MIRRAGSIGAARAWRSLDGNRNQRPAPRGWHPRGVHGPQPHGSPQARPARQQHALRAAADCPAPSSMAKTAHPSSPVPASSRPTILHTPIYGRTGTTCVTNAACRRTAAWPRGQKSPLAARAAFRLIRGPVGRPALARAAPPAPRHDAGHVGGQHHWTWWGHPHGTWWGQRLRLARNGWGRHVGAAAEARATARHRRGGKTRSAGWLEQHAVFANPSRHWGAIANSNARKQHG